MDTSNLITTFEISKNMNIKYGRLREWIDRKYILPSQPVRKKGEGQGDKNLFSRHDVYLIALFAHLTEMGFTREKVSSFLKPMWEWQKIDTRSIDGFKETLAETAISMPFFAICNKVGEVPPLTHTFFSKVDDTGNPCRNIKALQGYDDVTIVNFKKLCDMVDQAFR